MRVLVGCEESQIVCSAFRARGHDAYSCDLQPTRGNPEWHIQGDVLDAITNPCGDNTYNNGYYFHQLSDYDKELVNAGVIEADYHRWDLIILHPDCTALAVSGNRWYGEGMPKNVERWKAVEWTLNLWKLAIQHSNKVALENPVSVIFSELRITGTCKKVQYIQPWQFGHGQTKKTGFALHNLPPLVPTNVVEGREPRVWKMVPSPNRKRDRSETFKGIAEAMATQWGELNS